MRHIPFAWRGLLEPLRTAQAWLFRRLGGARRSGTLQRWLAGPFIVLNLSVVLFMNRTPAMVTACDDWFTAASPAAADRFQRANWLVRQYAYATGLDNRWIMFGRQSRFNWRFLFTARGADGVSALLPLPRQSQRSFLQRHFVDFREAKFHLNIYPNARALSAYASHLCRAYPSLAGTPVKSIRIELEHYMLHPPDEARKARTPVASRRYRSLQQEVPCES